MNIWLTLMLIVHVVAALGIIGLVLLQHGKGADMGAAFGGGASGSLFGATGSANFLSRATAILATVFFITSLGLAYIATQRPKESAGVMDRVPASTQTPVPSTSTTPPVPGSPTNEIPVPQNSGATSKQGEAPK
jgi:preprotein translocase subunit SecG